MRGAMLEYLADPKIIWSLLLIFSAIAVFALMPYLASRKERKSKRNAVVGSEWRLTGKIDFHCAETAAYVLRVEENRTIKSVDGSEHTEIRWRNAVLAEAKSVVAAHQNSIDTRTMGHQIPRLVRT